MFGPRFTFDLPWRLWRRVLAASDGDEQLARVTLATAFLVAAEHVASPPVPARAAEPRPWLPPEYQARDPEPFPEYLGDDPRDQDPAPSYLVEEGPPHEMPAADPWRRVWD